MTSDPVSSERDSRENRVPGFLLGLCLFISVFGLFDHDLWTPDEPREAAIALEMSRTGQWLVPHLAGQPFVEKPPLSYIVWALFLRSLGGWLGPTIALRLSLAVMGLMSLGLTYLLARRLCGARMAGWTAAILATLPGFVHVTHWLLVDNALLLFCVATIWALAEAYVGGRYSFLALAGLAAAGAFLCKGVIGPAVIGVAALGLFAPWAIERASASKAGVFPGWLCWGAWHFAGLLVLLGICMAWAAAFRAAAGPDLFREWWHINHVGRFSGQAVQLGHINPNPLYYLGVLPLYALTWLPLFGLGAWTLAGLLRRRRFSPDVLLPLIWGLGGLLLFSLSATKREIYLVVLMPAWAMIASRAMDRELPRWCGAWLAVMGWVFAVSLLFAAGPVLWLALDGTVARLLQALSVTILVAAGLALFLGRRRTIPIRYLAITAVLYIVALSIACPLVDGALGKGYGRSFRAFADGLLDLPEVRPALWAPDETVRAGLYYYGQRAFAVVKSADELERIMAGAHSDYNAVIACHKPEKKALPASVAGGAVLLEVRLRARCLQLIGSKAEQKGPPLQ